MNYCSRCGLPENFPGIGFDENEECNYCRHARIPNESEKISHLKRFEKLIEEKRTQDRFDVLLAYSGGKDSTYTLYLLREKYNLRVLALTFDNGFISEQALENIKKMTDTLDTASLILKPPFEQMKKTFALAASRDIYSSKTLDRASAICTTCIGIVKSFVLKTALSIGIPLVAYGWSPGQAPISSAVMKTNPRLQRLANKSVRDPLISLTGETLVPYFINERDLAVPGESWPFNIHPLAFTEYNEDKIFKTIENLGWIRPEDTDPNSTNCLLNALANHLHRERFGYHPYAWEIAGIVRSGSMERMEGIRKVTTDENPVMVRQAADVLGISL